MDPEHLSLFLRELHLIEKKYSMMEKSREQFNIFSVLFKYNDEVRLHSMFIASLLNPYGSHNQGDRFLRKFLTLCGYKSDYIDNLLANNHVVVSPNEYDRSEVKEIDILVLNSSTKHAFFIENKIDARDSNHEDRGQLEGYYETLMNEFHIPPENIQMAFLSINGREPSDASYGTRHVQEIRQKCKVRSYSQLVVPWLEECLAGCVEKPFLRESILQYIKLIKNMTNDISLEERKEIIELVGKNQDNLKAAMLLLENFKHIKWHTVTDFWNELTAKLVSVGCKVYLHQELDLDTITTITHNESYKPGYKYKDLNMRYECPSGMVFYVYYSYDDVLCFCVEKSKRNQPFKDSLRELLRIDDDCYGCDENNYIYKYFDVSDDEEICFSDFSMPGTYNLINPEYRDKIISKMVDEIVNVFRSVNVWD